MSSEENLLSPPPVEETGGGPTHFEWSAPAFSYRVRLSFDVVDDLGFEVMRGFGAIPRRGAEVGGVLTGQVDEQARIIEINGFAPVACKHRRGPSYVLEDDERAVLAETLAGVEAGGQKAVGFYRSNTRDAFHLDAEDLELLEQFFQHEPGLCLLIKPYPTRVSEAVFFHRVEGVWEPAAGGAAFPFRRSSLGGGKRPRRRRAVDDLPPAAVESPPQAAGQAAKEPPEPAPLRAQPDFKPIVVPDVPEFAEARPSRLHGSWVWIPLSFIFLLLGIVLGFQIALSVSRSHKAAEQHADPYSLELTAVEFGESLHLKWNSSLPAFRNAASAVLQIQDGNNTKTVEITREDISRGGILYKHASPQVRFRLEVPQSAHSSVTETLDVRVMAADRQPEDLRRGQGSSPLQ